jgi:hypothetical protein
MEKSRSKLLFPKKLLKTMKSIFLEKNTKPAPAALEQALGESYEIWRTLAAFAYKTSPGAVEEWSYGNTKTGWGFRITQKRKVLLHLVPRDKFFHVSFVFEQKVADAILDSDVSDDLKAEVKAAKVGLLGRTIKIDTTDKSQLGDVKKLIALQSNN